jgi:hypothetical protein
MEKRILCALLIVALLNTNLVWAADNDRLAELKKKIEAMQDAYESKIDSLESRIAELEGEKSKTLAQTPPPAESKPAVVSPHHQPTGHQSPYPIHPKSTRSNGCGNMQMPSN